MIEWNVDPEIFRIGPVALRYYSFSFVLGFFLGEKYVSRYMIKHGYTKEHVAKLFTFMLLGTIIGARLGHCLFYEPAYYLSHPLKILKVWEGGLASHGGFIGVMIAVGLFNKRVKKINLLWLLDLVAAPSLITGCYIRLGNLMNSEIIGHPTDVPWAFIFKRVDNIPRHPSQLYEAIGFFVISMIVFHLYKKYNEVWPSGRFVGLILTGGMAWRFFTEYFKENQVAFEEGMLMNMGQLLSIPMMILGIILVFREQIFSKKK